MEHPDPGHQPSIVIDTPHDHSRPPSTAAAQNGSKIWKFCTIFISCNSLIWSFAIGVMFFEDLLMADGMCSYAWASLTITVLGTLAGLHLEVMLARVEKITEKSEPLLRCYISIDMYPSILVGAIMWFGPSCAYLVSMSRLGSVTMWMLIFTLWNSIRKSLEISRRTIGRFTRTWSLFGCLLTSMTGLVLFTQPTRSFAWINGDCARHTATFRITANTVYPIVDFNSTDPHFVDYRLDTMIESDFNKVKLLRSKQMNISADCRRLAGFDRLLRTERDEKCTLTASTTMAPMNHSDSNRTLEFSLDISISSSDGVTRSVPFCPRDDGDLSLDYRPYPYEMQKIFRASCRLETEDTIYECPTMQPSMKIDESPTIAMFDCTRTCFAQPPVDQQKKLPTIRFKQLAARLIVGEREYELKYMKSPLCW